MLFESALPALLEKLEQVVRLTRSKGVGVYFVTQNPDDIPDDILGQIGNRVQHALRAFTPRDQKAVRAAASTFRADPDLSTEEMITQLGVGESLASVLNLDGEPTVVEQILVSPPSGKVRPRNQASADPTAADRAISKHSSKLFCDLRAAVLAED